MIDLVVTIKTHTESSKSELSSGTFGHFKVFIFYGVRRRKRSGGKVSKGHGVA